MKEKFENRYYHKDIHFAECQDCAVKYMCGKQLHWEVLEELDTPCSKIDEKHPVNEILKNEFIDMFLCCFQRDTYAVLGEIFKHYDLSYEIADAILHEIKEHTYYNTQCAISSAVRRIVDHYEWQAECAASDALAMQVLNAEEENLN